MNKLNQILDKLEKEVFSKQHRWQLKQKAMGNCIHCGKKAMEGSSLCQPEAIRRRLRARKAAGCKEKKEGCVGRPIKHPVLQANQPATPKAPHRD